MGTTMIRQLTYLCGSAVNDLRLDNAYGDEWKSGHRAELHDEQ